MLLSRGTDGIKKFVLQLLPNTLLLSTNFPTQLCRDLQDVGALYGSEMGFESKEQPGQMVTLKSHFETG